MNFVLVDKFLFGGLFILIIILQLLKHKLPVKLLIKNESSRVLFSIGRTKGIWLIPGIGFYVWGMDFLILNSAVKLRLTSTLLILVAFFSALIITNLSSQKLGKRLAGAGIVLFAASVIFFA